MKNDKRVIYQHFFAALERDNSTQLVDLLEKSATQKILFDFFKSSQAGYAAYLIHNQLKNKKPETAKALLSFEKIHDFNIIKHSSAILEPAVKLDNPDLFLWVYQNLKRQCEKLNQRLSLDNAYLVASRELKLNTFKAMATQCDNPSDIRSFTIIKTIENQLSNLSVYQNFMKNTSHIELSHKVFHIMLFEQNVLKRPEIENWFKKESLPSFLRDWREAWEDKNNFENTVNIGRSINKQAIKI